MPILAARAYCRCPEDLELLWGLPLPFLNEQFEYAVSSEKQRAIGVDAFSRAAPLKRMHARKVDESPARRGVLDVVHSAQKDVLYLPFVQETPSSGVALPVCAVSSRSLAVRRRVCAALA